MSDNIFIPVPLENDPNLEPTPEVIETEIKPLEGIQPEDSRPKGEDYIPERQQYIKRILELADCGYTPVSDMVRLLVKDLDNYSRGEITLEEIKNTCPEYEVEIDNEFYPNREYIIPYNHIRSRLLELYEKEFGEK